MTGQTFVSYLKRKCFYSRQELENFVRSRKSENEVEITALSQHLVSNHVMETSVKKELEEYQTRSQDLDKKVTTHSICDVF